MAPIEGGPPLPEAWAAAGRHSGCGTRNERQRVPTAGPQSKLATSLGVKRAGGWQLAECSVYYCVLVEHVLVSLLSDRNSERQMAYMAVCYG